MTVQRLWPPLFVLDPCRQARTISLSGRGAATTGVLGQRRRRLARITVHRPAPAQRPPGAWRARGELHASSGPAMSAGVRDDEGPRRGKGGHGYRRPGSQIA